MTRLIQHFNVGLLCKKEKAKSFCYLKVQVKCPMLLIQITKKTLKIIFVLLTRLKVDAGTEKI